MWSTNSATASSSQRPVGTVEDSHQSDSSPGNVLVEPLTMSLGNPVTHQSGNSPGHFPTFVVHFLGAGGATGGSLGWTVLLGDIIALLLVDLPGLAVTGGLVHRAALPPRLLVGDLDTFLLGNLGASNTSSVPLLCGVSPLTLQHVIILSFRHA